MTSSIDAAGMRTSGDPGVSLGADDDCATHWEAAHRAALAAGSPADADRYAFWLGLGLIFRGQHAHADGWFARADALIAEAGAECRASGYVLIPRCLAALGAGDPQHAHALGVRTAEIGGRFDDADLRAFGTLSQGQALIALGETVAGVARFDEVMVSATTGELGPVTTGIVYCAVILECMELFDLRRATEWTDALAAWCDAQPELVPYRGQCLVHRSRASQAGGNWSEAVASVRSARRHLADPPHPALGLALYQEGEMHHRLRGQFEQAEDNYRQASGYGHDPMPGLALCNLPVATIGRRSDDPAGVGRIGQWSVATGTAGGCGRNIPIDRRFRGGLERRPRTCR